ncbi:unnamed protein product [Cochlearia groenlandica]
MKEDPSNEEFLDLDKTDSQVWLMKCPVAVSKAWQKQSPSSSSSPSMAKIVLSLDPLNPEPEFTMEMCNGEYGNMPKSYSMNMFKDFVPMNVFSETNQVNLSSEGKIVQKFDMKPQGGNIEEYGKICRERTSRAMVKNRKTQVIDNDRGVHMRPMPGMVGLVSSNSKEKKKLAPVKQSEFKRTRRDRGEVEAIMFKLFEGKPNWTLKQLVQETAQPAMFLKEILNDLCVYNKRGSNQGTYELKPEYKKAT